MATRKLFRHCCQPWSLGPAERYDEEWCPYEGFHDCCQPWSLGSAERYDEEWCPYEGFHDCCQPWSLGSAERYDEEWCPDEGFHGCCQPWSLGPAGRFVEERFTILPSFTIIHSPAWNHTITSGHLEPEVARSSWPIKMGYGQACPPQLLNLFDQVREK
ncbi:hypothetical protein J6590_088183 [Homalodisca vitripennis]|nr:hypothetical protein J6590_088183 [Homalodisca vitripennis]